MPEEHRGHEHIVATLRDELTPGQCRRTGSTALRRLRVRLAPSSRRRVGCMRSQPTCCATSVRLACAPRAELAPIAFAQSGGLTVRPVALERSIVVEPVRCERAGCPGIEEALAIGIQRQQPGARGTAEPPDISPDAGTWLRRTHRRK